MKIEESIEILETAPVLHVDDVFPRERTALQLGIEALKRLKEYREDPEFPTWVLPLPGETEE